MKKLMFLLLAMLAFIACEKEVLPPTVIINPPVPPSLKDPHLKEQYVFDSAGVVFKIINDIDTLKNYQEGFFEKVDSLAFKKFQYIVGTDSIFVKKYFTWLKKGDYVCWRYNNSFNGWTDPRLITMGFINKHRYYTPYKYCSFATYLLYSPTSLEYKFMFPAPVNDTVYVKISSIFKVSFRNYIR